MSLPHIKKIETLDDYKDCNFYSSDASRISNRLARVKDLFEKTTECMAGLSPAITKELGVESIQLQHAIVAIPQIQRKLWEVVFYNEKPKPLD